jgi:hypothetical protein
LIKDYGEVKAAVVAKQKQAIYIKEILTLKSKLELKS